MTVTYCTHTDLEGFLRLGDTFDETSTPTLAQVEDIINGVEDYIDRKTVNAWRATTITNEMYHYPFWKFGWWSRKRFGVMIKLRHRNIVNPLVSGTDKMEIWTGSSYDDLVANYTEGRADDWWMDYQRGALYFISKYPYYSDNAIRATYRYGETSVPKDIKKAAIFLAAIELVTTEHYSSILPDGTDHVPYMQAVDKWEERADKILALHEELIVV